MTGTGPSRLDILWEDPHGLAVNKPAGLLTQPTGRGDGGPTLDGMVRCHLRPDDPGSAYLGTIHRLDRPVSGVVLWAKHPKAARRWAEQFAGRRARKTYCAIVERLPDAPPLPLTDLWTDWLTAPDLSGRARAVPAGTPGSVAAETRIELDEVLGDGPSGHGFARLHLHPVTGRTHQLRSQAASRGWPVVGDRTYGSATSFAEGIALHARTLQIEHPVRRDLLTLEAPEPPCWSLWLADSGS